MVTKKINRTTVSTGADMLARLCISFGPSLDFTVLYASSAALKTSGAITIEAPSMIFVRITSTSSKLRKFKYGSVSLKHNIIECITSL